METKQLIKRLHEVVLQASPIIRESKNHKLADELCFLSGVAGGRLSYLEAEIEKAKRDVDVSSGNSK